MIRKENVTDSEALVLRAYAFPGPFIFEKTPQDKMLICDFAFTTDGLVDVCNWLNQTYESHLELWKTSIF